MKKNVLIKSILVLVVITVLLLGLTGCLSVTPPTPTGTVYITITGFWSSGTHDIYMDGFYLGTTSTASYVIPNVTPGTHIFEAGQNIPGSTYDSETVYINVGSNYISLFPLMIIIMI